MRLWFGAAVAAALGTGAVLGAVFPDASETYASGYCVVDTSEPLKVASHKASILYSAAFLPPEKRGAALGTLGPDSCDDAQALFTSVRFVRYVTLDGKRVPVCTGIVEDGTSGPFRAVTVGADWCKKQ